MRHIEVKYGSLHNGSVLCLIESGVGIHTLQIKTDKDPEKGFYVSSCIDGEAKISTDEHLVDSFNKNPYEYSYTFVT